MPKVPYKYYWNLQTDEQGRSISMMDGFNIGDPLCLAHEGDIETNGSLAYTVLDELYYRFNAPGARPTDYRGPSMSIGSVVVLDSQKAYRCDRIGFSEVHLSDFNRSEIRPTDPRWKG
jgi:hypothetical protein